MKSIEVTVAAGAFAAVAAVITVSKLAYYLFVLDQTDDKMGTPGDQFETMLVIHLLATALAALSFGAGLLLSRYRSVEARRVVWLSVVAGTIAGWISLLRLAGLVEAVVPLSGIGDEIVAVLLAGFAFGAIVWAGSIKRRAGTSV